MTAPVSRSKLVPDKPAVSVIMTVFNGERYIAAAIGSVLRQTMANLELVVVDDGSTDGTLGIVRSFDDPRILIATPEHQGLSGASNVGMAMCRAPYVARLDSDDVMEPQRLERQLDFLSQRPHLGGAASFYWVIDEHGRKIGSHDPPLHTLEDLELQLRTGGRLIYAHSTLMLRRDVVAALGGYDSQYDCSEDVDLTMRMHQAGWPILVQPERLVHFRVHGASVSATRQRTQYFCNHAIFENFRRARRGEAPLPPCVYAELARSTPWRRAASEAKIASYRLRRRQMLLEFGGHPVLSAGLGVLAAILNPGAVAGVLARGLARRWRNAALPSPAKRATQAGSAGPRLEDADVLVL